MRILILILISLPLLSSAQEEWLPYRSPEGGFKIMTKGLFKEVITHAKTTIGDISIHSLVYPKEPKPGEMIFTVTFYDFPGSTMHSDSTEIIQTFYSQTIDAAAKSLGGEVIYDNDIMVHSFRGKQWRINYADNTMHIKSQAFLAGNRYYLISVISAAKDNTLSANHFFSSFRLLGYD
jgi:hypothetical protein